MSMKVLKHNPKNFTEIWQDVYPIHAYQVDVERRLTAPMLCRVMEESAWRHAEHLELGFSHLQEKGLVWVLARLYLRIDAYPLWGDQLHVHTFPSGSDRLFCYRDFQLSDQTGKTIGEAGTSWFVIDTVARKPQSTRSYMTLESHDDLVQKHLGQLKKLPAAGGQDHSDTIRVRYQDIDINGHVNNVRYLDWMLDSFPLHFHQQHRLRELQINFLAESFYEDALQVVYEQLNDRTFRHEIVRLSDQIAVCRAVTGWVPNADFGMRNAE